MRELTTVVAAFAREVGEDVLVVMVALGAAWMLALSWLPAVVLVPLCAVPIVGLTALESVVRKWRARAAIAILEEE